MTQPQERISNLFAQGSPLLSVEFFPPRSEAAVDSLVDVAKTISTARPDFASVTFGAGGSTRSRSATVSKRIKDEAGLRVMPHLTCVGSDKKEIGETVQGFHDEGYRNIMALRGDPPKGEETFVAPENGYSYGSDLVAHISRDFPDICLGVAGYPEKHPEAPSLDKDLDNLMIKVDAGASFITTQLFFDNDIFFDYVEKVRARGISLPIVPGIMPVLSLKQIRRITSLCGSVLPADLDSKLTSAGEDAETVSAIGVEWARTQIEGLLDGGVPGVHLYVLNRSDCALELMKAFRNRVP